ncbi:MAG: DUF2027 domain-containing protein [Odoribacter sp.]|nr:DUF2027 domain-containing protein [Odoribacter sp.]
MNIRIGDLVRFITEKLEGKVTSIIDQQTVNVFVEEYGFEIPAAVNDLVVIRSDFAPAAGNTQQKEKTAPAQAVRMESADTLYIAVVPENFNNLPESRYELFLVNDTDQTCLYSIAFRKEDKYTGIAAGNCNPDATCSLGIFSLKEIDTQIKAVNVKAIFFRKGNLVLKSAIEAEIKLNSVNLCKAGAYKHTRWFNAISMLRPLDKEHLITLEQINETDLQQALWEKTQSETKPMPRPLQQINGNIVEIDLHADQLLETTAGMENKDILEYQLSVFRQKMDEYKLRKGQKLIFIHGKGDGVLRQRILWELETKYKRHHHQDASFKQYGYGATQVTIK